MGFTPENAVENSVEIVENFREKPVDNLVHNCGQTPIVHSYRRKIRLHPMGMQAIFLFLPAYYLKFTGEPVGITAM